MINSKGNDMRYPDGSKWPSGDKATKPTCGWPHMDGKPCKIGGR